MDKNTARALIQLNNEFYRCNAASFSATRHAAWQGWDQCMAAMADLSPSVDHHVQVIDAACGNMRFADYLGQRWGDQDWAFIGVDACVDLVPDDLTSYDPDDEDPVHFIEADILDCLMNEQEQELVRDISQKVERLHDYRHADIVTSFGFMHHVPGQDLRMRLIDLLLDLTCPCGYIAVSFWQFLNSSEVGQRAQQAHASKLGRAPEWGIRVEELDPGDYLMGWQLSDQETRYCHHFSDCDIDEICTHCADRAEVVARFAADGRTGNLNQYVVWKKR